MRRLPRVLTARAPPSLPQLLSPLPRSAPCRNTRRLRPHAYAAFSGSRRWQSCAAAPEAPSTAPSATESNPERSAPSPLERSQLAVVALNSFVPFLAFGFFDNAIMIIAGEKLDATLCVTLGYSTMAAAALGNTLSDQVGLALGGVIETAAEKSGMPVAEVSHEQQRTTAYKLAHHGGSVIGITIGCVLGMVPLLFLNCDEGQMARMREKMDDAIFHIVEDTLKGMVKSERASLFTLDKEANVLRMVLSKEDVGKVEVSITADTYVSRCYRSGRPLNVKDMNPDDSKFGFLMTELLSVPVFDSSGIIGVIQMLNKVDGDKFSNQDERMAIKFATMLGSVLQGYEGISNLPELLRLEQDYELGQQQKIVEEEVFEAVVKDLSGLAGADRSSLWLVDREREQLYTLAAGDHVGVIRIPLDKGIVGQVVKTKACVCLDDAYKSELFDPSTDRATGYRTKSVLAAPLFSEDQEVAGVLQVINKLDAQGFNEADRICLMNAAVHISMALGSSDPRSIVKRLRSIQHAATTANASSLKRSYSSTQVTSTASTSAVA